MKKFLFALAFVGLATAAFAQDETLEEKHSVVTNSFGSNWFVSANYQFSSNYGSQEGVAGLDDFDNNPFKDFRSNHGFTVGVGKWFTPGLGLRLKGSFFKSKAIVSEDKDVNDFDAWRAEADALFNLTNMILGYKEDRVYNFIPYVGFGWAHNMSHTNNAKAYSFGLLNTFAINKRVAINFELGAFAANEEFDGVTLKDGGSWWALQDMQYAAELGLTVNLGKTLGWKKAPDMDAIKAKHDGELAALNSQLSDAQAANRRLQDELAQKPKEVIKTVVEKVGVSTPLSVFFNLSSSKIAGTRELVNLEALANAVKENGGKITVTGYADSKTGSAKINERLGQKRAEAVAAKLKSYGISEDQITIVNGGGVDVLNPFSYNRRAVVEVK